jgi:lysophospholipase L1-like esterase
MGETTKQMANELEQVILILRKDNPNVSILLAKVIPTAKPLWNSRLAVLNAEIDGIAGKMSIPASRVIVVDFTKGFNPIEDTFDRTHPNSMGSEKMAQKWFEGIVDLLKKE